MIERDQQRRLDELNGEGLVIPATATPLDFLCAVYRNPTQPMGRRIRAAEAALAFVHPKLAVTALVNTGPGARLERALARVGR